jgi:hypothetical protein
MELVSQYVLHHRFAWIIKFKFWMRVQLLWRSKPSLPVKTKVILISMQTKATYS